MNNQEFLEDMKQLLRAEISGAVQHLEKRMDSLAADLEQVREEMVTKADLEETQEAIADILTTGLESVDSKQQVNDHDRRITLLERRAA